MMSKIFCLCQALCLIIIAMALFRFLPISGAVDQSLIMPFIDNAHGFMYKDFWWYDRFAHHDLKLFQELILAIILINILSAKLNIKETFIKNTQEYTQLLCFMLISIIVITLLKRMSIHSCPWYILDLNHQQISFSNQLGQGGCFPGGHASLGYAWMAGFFIFYSVDKTRAYFYLISGTILGSAMGYTQMMRGAHFLSHNMWSMWITYAVDFLFYIFLMYYRIIFKR